MYVVIAGGGVIGGNLASQLVANRHDVVVIERDEAICERIAARTGVLAIRGAATNIDLLEDAGIEKADVAVAAMPRDGDNLAFCLLCRNFKVPRIFSRMRNPRYEEAYRLAGVLHTINVPDLFVTQLVLEIEQPKLRQVATFGRGKGAAIVVASIPERARVNGMTVQQIAGNEGFPADCIIAGIFREGDDEFMIPRGHITVSSGDQVFLAASATAVRKAAKFLQERS